jgi:hypothetical protein
MAEDEAEDEVFVVCTVDEVSVWVAVVEVPFLGRESPLMVRVGWALELVD